MSDQEQQPSSPKELNETQAAPKEEEKEEEQPTATSGEANTAEGDASTATGAAETDEEESATTTSEATEQKKEADAADAPAKDEKENDKQAEEDEAARQEKEEEEAAKDAEIAAEIEKLEKEVAELESVVQEKTKEAEEATGDQEASRTQLKEAQERHADAIREFNKQEEKKAEIQPTYEECLANKEQKERADQYKRSIADLEVVVENNEKEMGRLEQEMEKASAEYASEKEKLESFSKALAANLDDLANATKSKIEGTIDGPPQPAEGEEDSEEHAAVRSAVNLKPIFLLDALEAIVRQREREASHAARQLRELKAICEMKAEEEEKLQLETGDLIDVKRKENDEHIKQLIYGFQETRSRLQADIEEIRRVNKDQSYNLHRGHVQKQEKGQFTPAPGARTPRSGSGAATPRQSSFRKDTAKSREAIALQDANEKMQTELNTLKKKISAATADRTDGIQTLKSLNSEAQRDQIRFREDLHKKEAEVAATYLEVEQIEKENRRLAEAVEHLTTIVDTTRKQVRHIRAHHDPLPIEDVDEDEQ